MLITIDPAINYVGVACLRHTKPTLPRHELPVLSEAEV